MPTTQAARTVRTTEIISTPCTQCGSHKTVCERQTSGAVVRRFLACPHCGFTEERANGQHRRWQGHGVYVVRTSRDTVHAGAFDKAIPDHLVTQVVAQFLEMGPAVQYVTRWNRSEKRLEVLLGSAESARPRD